MKKRWRKIGFYIMKLVHRRRRRVKKKIERKRGRTKIIACKHFEIKHDSIMIWYIDMKQNKKPSGKRERKRRNNERNVRPKCGAKFCVSIQKESTKSTLSCSFSFLCDRVCLRSFCLCDENARDALTIFRFSFRFPPLRITLLSR